MHFLYDVKYFYLTIIQLIEKKLLNDINKIQGEILLMFLFVRQSISVILLNLQYFS